MIKTRSFTMKTKSPSFRHDKFVFARSSAIRSISLIALSLFLLAGSLLPAAADAATRVLFIGNSFTHYNAMPSMFGTIAANQGQDVEVTMYAPGSTTLSDHSADPDALALIDQGNWDFVVLQEQSTWPSACAISTFAMGIETDIVEELYDRVKASNPNASIVLYETWAWEEGRIISEYNADPNSAKGPDAATMQARTSYTYHYLADYLRGVGKNDVRVAHVGDAREVNRLGQNYNMFHDASHPNVAGSYLAALVIYSTIFEADPLDVTYDRLSATDSAYVRSIARYSAYISAPNPPRNPTANVTDTNQVIGWDEPIFAQMTGTNGLATGYVVERSLTSGGPYTEVGTVATNQFSDTDISADGPYYYVISATNSFGTSPVSKELIVVRAAPATPTGFLAQGGHTKTLLTWDTVPGADSYTIKRATSSGGPYTDAATGITGTNYTDTGLLDNTAYYYVVSATNAYGASSDSAEASATTVEPELVAHYEMDGDATDSSGNSLDATVAGAPTYPQGNFEQAIAFNGSSDYATAPQNVANFNDITVSAWIYWDGGSNWQRIFDFGNDTNHYMFLTPSTGGKLRFAIKNGGSEQIVDTSTLSTGVWTHVAVTLEWDTATLYVNGEAVSSNTAVTINPSDFNPEINYIGKSQFEADPLFNGRIDDFRIYSGALSPAELAVRATPPAGAPQELIATPGDMQATLTWNANATDTYTVKRSTTSGGPYTTVATDLTNLTYTDTGLTNGVTYYYVVSGANINGPGPDSTEVSITPTVLRLDLRFDETDGSTAFDSSSSAFDATLVNEPAFSGGRIGNALVLDEASSQHATLPSGIVSNLNDFTISTWIKVSSFATWQRVFDFGTGTNNYMYLSAQGPAGSGRPRFGIRTPSANEQSVDSSIALSAGVWTHVTVTRSGDTVSIYIDGALAGSGTITLNPADLGATTLNYIGKSQWSDPYLDAALDDFQIYSRAFSPLQQWRQSNFGTTADSGNAADSADPDGDGWTNAQEYITGTDPTDHNSTLEINELQIDGTDMLVSFPTVSGTNYRLEWSETLQPDSWTTVQDNIAGTSGILQLTDSNGAGKAKRFYRLVVSP